jgi:hypothetical protein
MKQGRPERFLHRVPVIVLAWASVASVCAEEPELVATESAAILPLAGGERLVVRGFEGEVLVQAGRRPQELRFTGVGAGREDAPVSLLRSGPMLLLVPAEGESRVRGLRVDVPAELPVRLELSRAKVAVRGLGERLEIQGQRLELRLESLSGLAEVDLGGGSVEATGLRGFFHLRGGDLTVRLARLEAPARLTLSRSDIRLEQLSAGAQVDLEGGSLTVDGVGGPLSVTLQDGRARVVGLAAGGELKLSDSPLELRTSRGEVAVETDAELRLHDNEATLRVEGYGASVWGAGNRGAIELRTDGAEVSVERSTGPLTIEGSGLTVRLKNLGAESAIRTSTSTVEVEDAAGPLTVDNDLGDVLVRGASHKVIVRSRGGNVQLVDLAGAAEVEADGPQVDVAWRHVGREASSIENAGGDVRVRFPEVAGGRVEAEARSGRVESELPMVRVSDDGTHASGVLGPGGQPTIRVRSEGNVYLTRQGSAESPS